MRERRRAGDTTVSGTVADHRPGVPEDEVVSLFERFGTDSSRGPDRPGDVSSGFGLYLTAGLTVANGGRVEYSVPPDGAALILRLPTRRTRIVTGGGT